MSRLEDLIQELCPNGVEYKSFLEVCTYTRGVTYNKSQEAKQGESDAHKVLRANNITLSSNTLNFDNIKLVSSSVRIKKEQYLYQGDILICAGSGSKEHIGKVAYITEDMDYSFGGFMAVIRSKGFLISRFLFHIFSGKGFKEYLDRALNSSTINNLSMNVIKDFQIPVPPLEVQHEIVRILESFTELATELTTELTARKQQYEYYRDKLLVNNESMHDVPWKPLGDICSFVRGPFGGSLKKDCFVQDGYVVYEQQNAIYNKFSFRYHITEEKFNELRRFEVFPGDLIMSCSGTMGKIAIVPEDAPKGIINQALLKITVGPELDNQFLKYCFEAIITKKFNETARGGAIKNVASVNELKKFAIPVPPLEDQKRLVQILNNFDFICSDLTSGLPAEIEARQKQYEYYRDKLLTFQEKEA